MATALVLVALPAAAQYGNTSTPPAQPADNSNTLTTSNPNPSSGTLPATEERTNPSVPTHSEDPGLTASGTVASWNKDEVVLNTSTGLTHFKLMPTTVGPTTFTEGQRVAIDFERNEQGVLLAKQIRLNEAVSTAPSGITTTGASAAGGEVASAATSAANEVAPLTPESTTTESTMTTPSTTTTTETTPTTATSTTLPATASNSPLLALLGLLALGAAAGLRRL
ncbi:MAG TPA: hypothetical protein VGV61_17835 [Thermoanaerobaculia bacterium]|jgi:hypothetical protein|nr:hypothetical protein [Thermoanaerobaculia bacterium]